MQDVRERGTQEVLLFVSDGLKGIVDAIGEVYPQAKYQKCCVHLARTIAHKVRVSDRAEICGDFKSVYRADDEQAGKAALETFCDKWKSSYPKVVKSLRENPYIFTFYSFPKPIWRSTVYYNMRSKKSFFAEFRCRWMHEKTITTSSIRATSPRLQRPPILYTALINQNMGV